MVQWFHIWEGWRCFLPPRWVTLEWVTLETDPIETQAYIPTDQRDFHRSLMASRWSRAGTMKLCSFAKFGSDLDPSTQKQLNCGVRLYELLKQAGPVLAYGDGGDRCNAQEIVSKVPTVPKFVNV
eukprot:gene33510-41356_t